MAKWMRMVIVGGALGVIIIIATILAISSAQ